MIQKSKQIMTRWNDLNMLKQTIDQRVHVMLNDHAQNEYKKQQHGSQIDEFILGQAMDTICFLNSIPSYYV